MNKQFNQTLFPKDFSKESIADAVMGFADLSKHIAATKKQLFAASLIHYFHDNPDAILFIQGQDDEDYDDGSEWNGTFISRVDIPYVKSIAAKALSPIPGVAIFKSSIDRDYNENALEFRGTGNDDKDIEKLPADLNQLTVSEFNSFIIPEFQELWSSIGDFDSRGIEFSGMTYAKQHLHELLSHFKIDHHTLIAGIESAYLKTQTISHINQSTTPGGAL